ncbi:Eukaryotic porin/Tom40 [Dillenia turbinata]|uniref:Eukaryotic porin/Tom40 n=1 Tax=Dillenia turbinata TaxID=194707 RepID=A0AAN8V4Z5_9MAGN
MDLLLNNDCSNTKCQVCDKTPTIRSLGSKPVEAILLAANAVFSLTLVPENSRRLAYALHFLDLAYFFKILHFDQYYFASYRRLISQSTGETERDEGTKEVHEKEKHKVEDVKDIAPGLHTVFTLFHQDQEAGRVEFRYLHDYVGITAGIGFKPQPVLTCSTVIGTNNLSLGADFSYDTEKEELRKFNGGLSLNIAGLVASAAM